MAYRIEGRITADRLPAMVQWCLGEETREATTPRPCASPLPRRPVWQDPLEDGSPMQRSCSDGVKHAIGLAWLTVVWMLLEAAGALFAGLHAQSLTLMAFGVESGMKLLAASVLLGQLAGERAHGHVFAARAAQCVGQMRGGVLLALALSIMISAARGLWLHHGGAFSLLGLLLALCAIPLMWFLSTAKLRLAAAVGSHALRADAFESITYGCLSCVVVLGLSTAWVLHVWWVDNVTAVVIVYVLTLQRYLINSLA